MGGSNAFWGNRSSLTTGSLGSRVIFSEESLRWQMPRLLTWREIKSTWMTASMRMHFLLQMMRMTLCSSLLG